MPPYQFFTYQHLLTGWTLIVRGETRSDAEAKAKEYLDKSERLPGFYNSWQYIGQCDPSEETIGWSEIRLLAPTQLVVTPEVPSTRRREFVAVLTAGEYLMGHLRASGPDTVAGMVSYLVDQVPGVEDLGLASDIVLAFIERGLSQRVIELEYDDPPAYGLTLDQM